MAVCILLVKAKEEICMLQVNFANFMMMLLCFNALLLYDLVFYCRHALNAFISFVVLPR